MTRLVLGSASSGRLRVLRGAGVDPLVIVSGVDEDAIIAAHPGASPDRVVGELAAAKARDVVRAVPAEVGVDCVVIGCDSMLYLDGQLRGKPGTVAEARAQWDVMAGRSGDLHSGHCLIRLRDGVVVHSQTRTSVTAVHFATPTRADLDAYLDSGEPLGVAGSFTLDGLGGWFVDRIEGDPSTVIGLSLPLTRALLADAGLSIAALWTANLADGRAVRPA
ncbi:nucleoside triphosphate pyrophosphatase [soil metagenome]